jgi:hypothetical protein
MLLLKSYMHIILNIDFVVLYILSQAQLTYDDAVQSGKTAMLLKEDSSAGDIFSCMLGNLPAKTEASLVMKYVIELPQEPDGQLRFTLPTVLNPRYSPGSKQIFLYIRLESLFSNNKFKWNIANIIICSSLPINK